MYQNLSTDDDVSMTSKNLIGDIDVNAEMYRNY